MIAWYNVRHCREVGGEGFYLDLDYLRSLGPEVIPALDSLSARLPGTPIATRVGNNSMALRGELEGQMRNWRGWTYRRQQLTEYAEHHPPLIAEAHPK